MLCNPLGKGLILNRSVPVPAKTAECVAYCPRLVQMPHTPHTPHTPGSAHTPGGGGAHTPGSSHTPGPPSVDHHSLTDVDIPADLNFDPAAVIDGEGTDNLNVSIFRYYMGLLCT